MIAVLKLVLKFLASLRITVVLFALSVFLVFAGTVAQIDKGIWTVVHEYFRCFFTWMDLQIFFPRSWNVPGRFLFPGGFLIGTALLVNIIAAHAVRFKAIARGPRLAAGLLVLTAGGALMWLIIAGVFTQDVAATEGAAFWRVMWRLIQGGGAAAILLVGCLLVFGRRAGIVLLHGGVIVLFASEVVTHVSATEGNMRINAGQTVNHVTDNRSAELVFIDRADPEFDRMTVIPRARLLRGGTVRDELLPFDVEVVRYMKNCDLIDARRAQAPNPATAGNGLIATAVERPEVSGTSADKGVDVPGAYVTLKRKDGGEDLGTYLVTPYMPSGRLPRQIVSVDGAEYDLELRFKRTYKPYSLTLIEFRHDKYVGTETPKNFSSLVRLVDNERNVDRTVKIWMNNPLRYAGETFYQSSFEPGRNLTILQVVQNDGWMLPYLACMIVGAGMTLHFCANLLGFLRKRVSL